MAAIRGMASMQPWCGSKYALGPELGSGGMATVHFGLLVGDLGFGRVVAIKRIHPRLAADQEMVEHLRDEARVAARIRHPNVVSVLDIVAAGSELGIVLDYVHGESLSALIQQARARTEPIGIGICVSLAIDVLHGLHAAHTATDERGELLHVVHRDISPQNVLVGVDGIARVLDFGIAKAKNRSHVTRDGAVKGKLAYMAPEQLGGDVSEQSDVYALGLVLWELLAGEGPFAAAETDPELVGLVLKGVSLPPSKARPEVPTVLDDIVLRALASVASRRFASASEMAQALERTGLGATRTEVAAFVAELAAESVAHRTAIVAAIEARPPIAAPVSASDSVMPKEIAPPSGAIETGVEVASVPARKRPSLRGRVVALMIAVLLVLGVTAMAVIGARARAGGSNVTASPSVTLAPSGLTSPAPSDVPVASSNPPSATVQAAVPSAIPAATPSASTSTRPRPTSTVRRSPRAPDCSIPYTVDADGQRRYRRECFGQ